MNRQQGGQALVEWAASSLVLMVFALGILAAGQIVGQYQAVRSAASQAAFAAARAPSEQAAQDSGRAAAGAAAQGSQLEDFTCVLDTGGFERGGVVTAAASGYVNLAAYPIIKEALGHRVRLSWQAHALIEPYRSRTP